MANLTHSLALKFYHSGGCEAPAGLYYFGLGRWRWDSHAQAAANRSFAVRLV